MYDLAQFSASAGPHQQALDNSVAVLSLVVNHFDVIQVGVSPVHQAVDQVEGDAVGEDDLGVHQFGAVLAVHVAALHPRSGAVVCEKHFAAGKKRGSRVSIMSIKESCRYRKRMMSLSFFLRSFWFRD